MNAPLLSLSGLVAGLGKHFHPYLLEIFYVRKNNSVSSKALKTIGVLIVIAVVVALFAFFYVASDSPSAVVKQLHASVNKEGSEGNWNTFCVPEVKYGGTGAWGSLDLGPAGLRDEGNVGINSIKHTIDGNTASVEIIYDSGRTQVVGLIKLSGKWKVSKVYR